ncbi:MAG: hypothetical protein IAF94_00220 [Pirellulaceae bacterium]|nr:hypothetical protein [Pirellulaceae bacterium]
MVAVIANDAFDRVVEPVFRMLSQEQLRELTKVVPDPSLENRVEELAGKCNEGTLTPEERTEYEAYVRANKFVALMQGQARKILAGL